MLDLQVLRIRQIFNMEELLDFFDAFFRQVYHFILFIDHKVAGLLDVLAHNGVHLGKFAGGFAPLQLSGQNVADLVQLGGLSALSGNNQGRPGFVDQHRVHLIDDGVVQIPQHHLLFVDRHVVPQVVKSQFVVGHIGNVAVICLFALLGIHGVQHHAYGQTQEFMDLSHPLRVTLGQIVVDRNDVHAFAGQGVQIRRRRGNQRLSFTGLHLGDTSLMQHDAADQLYGIMLHIQRSSGRFPHRGKRLRQNVVQGFSGRQPLLEDPGAVSQLLVRQRHHFRPHGHDFINNGIDQLQFTLTVSSKHLLNEIHGSLSYFLLLACFSTMPYLDTILYIVSPTPCLFNRFPSDS